MLNHFVSPVHVLAITAILCQQVTTPSRIADIRPDLKDPVAIGATTSQSDSQTEARRIWEQAIGAKGGRERLYTVRNIVISARGEYTTHELKKNQIKREVLYVLPYRLWSWEDYRPDVFGLTMRMYDYETNKFYLTSPQEPRQGLKPITDKQKHDSITYAVLAYLPETRWMKPELVSANTGKVGLQRVDIVHTMVDGDPVDFALDRKTHLPVRVSFYSTYDNKTYVTKQTLADYIEVAGIKVPRSVEYDDGTKDKLVIQFNVEYNEDIFVTPPPIESGPEAWRPRRGR